MTSKFPGCLSLPNLIAIISRLDAALDPKKVAVAIHRLIGCHIRIKVSKAPSAFSGR
jgi:hypothetical protein